MIRRAPSLVLDNGQTPDEWTWEYTHSGAMMVVTILKTGKEIHLLDKETLTLSGTAFGIRECREKLDAYLAQR